jgi:hypothetical protein
MGACTSVPHTEKSEGIADEDRDATPSFALLDVQGPVIVTYVYQLVDGEVSPTLFDFNTFLIVVHSSLPNIPVPNSSTSRLAPCSASAFVHPPPLTGHAI